MEDTLEGVLEDALEEDASTVFRGSLEDVGGGGGGCTGRPLGAVPKAAAGAEVVGGVDIVASAMGVLGKRQAQPGRH